MDAFPNFHPQGRLTEEFPGHVVEAVYGDRIDECGVVVRSLPWQEAKDAERWPEGFLYNRDAEQLSYSILAATHEVEKYKADEVMKIIRGEREPDGPNPHGEEE